MNSTLNYPASNDDPVASTATELAAQSQRKGWKVVATALLAMLAVSNTATASATEEDEPAYEITDFDWVDQSRSRAVPVRLYWPTNVQPGTSVPLVVFSHGIGGSRKGYSYLGKHWSSHGVASLHVQHVGSDSTLWRGNPFGVVDRLHDAAQEREAMARASDVHFALDQMLSTVTGQMGAAVDQQRIVVAGHSYGANTALLSIGAQVVREGQVINYRDPRFVAAVIISAPPFYGESNLAAVLGQISVPTLHVTATDDVIQIPGYRSGADDRLAIYDAVANPTKLLAVFRDGSHSIFTDRSLTGGPSLNAKTKAATADLSLAFLDLVFRGDGAALTQWQNNWQPILAQARGMDTASQAPVQHAVTN
ncbi:alpha/beta hydrolase family protein [Pseudomonas sp. o96-267]|uniref:alpha/beta hydrolase family protein n=1 Tax=Pseudomonas sp. o96-267 TaxID=2479853 RepID=UPI0015ABBC55|nr:acetylhydrolase [Pseudomonas sp. o96-267]